MIVTVCICTFQRPQLLDDLLASIEAMELPRCRLRIVVVDNDAEGSARPVTERRHGLDLTFDVEPRRSISAVRNRSVRIALELGSDVVVFLDDDETVDGRWLCHLLGAFERLGAHAVAGAVVPVLGQAPSWVQQGDFFSRPRKPTGARLTPSGIANFLIDASVLASIPDPFGTHFGRPGGEDTYFLERISTAFGMPYWCDEAVVYEHVPSERATARWLFWRAVRFGRAYSEALRLHGASRRSVLVRAAKCCARVVQGVVLLPAAALRGRAAMVRTMSYTCSGIGGLVGLATSIE